MATVETWAVDLADVGAVYPMVGSETIMVIVAVVAWLVWHIVQMRAEQRQHREEVRLHGSRKELDQVIDDDSHKF